MINIAIAIFAKNPIRRVFPDLVTYIIMIQRQRVHVSYVRLRKLISRPEGMASPAPLIRGPAFSVRGPASPVSLASPPCLTSPAGPALSSLRHLHVSEKFLIISIPCFLVVYACKHVKI